MPLIKKDINIDRLLSLYIFFSSIRLLLVDGMILPSTTLARLSPFGFVSEYIIFDLINYLTLFLLISSSFLAFYFNKIIDGRSKILLLYSFLIFLNIFIDHYSFHHSTYFIAVACFSYYVDKRFKSTNFIFSKTIVIASYFGAGFYKINASFLEGEVIEIFLNQINIYLPYIFYKIIAILSIGIELLIPFLIFSSNYRINIFSRYFQLFFHVALGILFGKGLLFNYSMILVTSLIPIKNQFIFRNKNFSKLILIYSLITYLYLAYEIMFFLYINFRYILPSYLIF